MEKKDISISAYQANLWATPLLLLIGGLALLPFYLIYGNVEMGAFGELHWFISSLIVGIILHEAIHALGWMYFGNIPFKEMKFGIHWATLTPYAHCKIPMKKKDYKLGVLLPMIIVGLLPYMAGLITGLNSLMWFGVVLTSAAAGDLLVYWLMRNIDDEELVKDHPSRVGCIVMGNPAQAQA